MPGRQEERKERLTDLELLRLGAPGKPKQKDIARRMKASKAWVSKFESGAVEVKDAYLRAYAKALGSHVTVKEVARRYWSTRAAYCLLAAKLARENLEHLVG